MTSTIDTGRLAEVGNFRDWRAAYEDAWNGRLVSKLPAAVDAAQFTGAIEFRRVRDLEFILAESMPFSGRSRPTPHMPSQAGPSDYIGLQVSLVHGGERLLCAGNKQIETTRAMLYDGRSIEGFMLHGPGKYFNVLIPREAMKRAAGFPIQFDEPVFETSTQALRLLEGLLKSLADEFGTMRASAFDSVRTAIIELVVGLAREDRARDSGAMSDAMFEAICRWIEDQLHDSDIRPTVAAAAHGISVRTLHRLFGVHDSSFCAVVRSKRFDKALADLASSNDPVTVIASRWGFADTSHLSREVRRRLDLTPTEYRTLSRNQTGRSSFRSGPSTTEQPRCP